MIDELLQTNEVFAILKHNVDRLDAARGHGEVEDIVALCDRIDLTTKAFKHSWINDMVDRGLLPKADKVTRVGPMMTKG